MQVHNASNNEKYNIKAQDSVIGTNSSHLKKIFLNQIPNDPQKTKQLFSNLKLSEGEKVEIAINVRTEDGITNGAAAVVKRIALNHKEKPTGLIWVQFDHSNIGKRTRHENRQLYRQKFNPLGLP